MYKYFFLMATLATALSAPASANFEGEIKTFLDKGDYQKAGELAQKLARAADEKLKTGKIQGLNNILLRNIKGYYEQLAKDCLEGYKIREELIGRLVKEEKQLAQGEVVLRSEPEATLEAQPPSPRGSASGSTPLAPNLWYHPVGHGDLSPRGAPTYPAGFGGIGDEHQSLAEATRAAPPPPPGYSPPTFYQDAGGGYGDTSLGGGSATQFLKGRGHPVLDSPGAKLERERWEKVLKQARDREFAEYVDQNPTFSGGAAAAGGATGFTQNSESDAAYARRLEEEEQQKERDRALALALSGAGADDDHAAAAGGYGDTTFYNEADTRTLMPEGQEAWEEFLNDQRKALLEFKGKKAQGPGAGRRTPDQDW